MKVHTTPKIHELGSPTKNPSVSPSTSSQQTASFNMITLPTGKAGKFWYYVTAVLLKVVTTFDQAAAGGVVVNADKLWKILASVQIQSPGLGEVYAHRNTRGSVLGNIIQVLGLGYQQYPMAAQIAAADGDTTVTLYYRIPFALEFLAKPHESSPWTGLLEGGVLEAKLDVSTVLDGDSTGAVLKAPTNFRAWLELIPSPEAVIHTPFHFREYVLPGSTTRHTLPDMGAPDGLKGVDLSKGAGLAALYYLTDATGSGLSGADGIDNITGVDINWRDQDRIDSPDAFMAALFAMKKRYVGGQGAVKGTTIPSDLGWPFTIGAANTETFAGAPGSQAMIFPLVSPGYRLETSKLQTVKGARDINFGYGATPAGATRFVSLEFPVFDDGFCEGLKDSLLGGSIPGTTLAAKTLNKQKGGVPGIGKLAYTRRKVVPVSA